MPRKVVINVADAIIAYAATAPVQEVSQLLATCTTIVKARASQPTVTAAETRRKPIARPATGETPAGAGLRAVPKPGVRQPSAEDQKALDDAKTTAAAMNRSNAGTAGAPKPPKPPKPPVTRAAKGTGPKRPAPPVVAPAAGAPAAPPAPPAEPLVPETLPPQDAGEE